MCIEYHNRTRTFLVEVRPWSPLCLGSGVVQKGRGATKEANRTSAISLLRASTRHAQLPRNNVWARRQLHQHTHTRHNIPQRSSIHFAKKAFNASAIIANLSSTESQHLAEQGCAKGSMSFPAFQTPARPLPGAFVNTPAASRFHGQNVNRQLFRTGDRKSTRLNSSHWE